MQDQKFRNVFRICAVMLIAGSIANLYALFTAKSPLFQVITSIGLIITSLFGAVYIFSGYTKVKSAKFFTAFMSLYALTEMIGTIGAKSINTINMMLLVLSFGCAFVLAVAKDLGERKSLVLSGTIVLSVIGRLIISAMTSALPIFGIRPLTKLLLGISVFVLVLAKYRDKKARGTK